MQLKRGGRYWVLALVALATVAAFAVVWVRARWGTFEIDRLVAAHEQLTASERKALALRALESLRYVEGRAGEARREHTLAKLGGLYERTQDVVLLDALDETALDGRMKRDVCALYRKLLERPEAVARYRSAPAAVLRCADSGFTEVEVQAALKGR